MDVLPTFPATWHIWSELTLGLIGSRIVIGGRRPRKLQGDWCRGLSLTIRLIHAIRAVLHIVLTGTVKTVFVCCVKTVVDLCASRG